MDRTRYPPFILAACFLDERTNTLSSHMAPETDLFQNDERDSLLKAMLMETVRGVSVMDPYFIDVENMRDRYTAYHLSTGDYRITHTVVSLVGSPFPHPVHPGETAKEYMDRINGEEGWEDRVDEMITEDRKMAKRDRVVRKIANHFGRITPDGQSFHVSTIGANLFNDGDVIDAVVQRAKESGKFLRVDEVYRNGVRMSVHTIAPPTPQVSEKE